MRTQMRSGRCTQVTAIVEHVRRKRAEVGPEAAGRNRGERSGTLAVDLQSPAFGLRGPIMGRRPRVQQLFAG